MTEPVSSDFHKTAHTQNIKSIPFPFFDSDSKQPFISPLTPQAAYSPKIDDSGQNSKLEILSSTSGRTLIESATLDKVLWGGSYPADVYGARDLKGARQETPILEVVNYTNQQKQIIATGMLTEVPQLRIKTGSEFLRSHGLPTEHAIRLSILKEVASPNGPIPIDEWKKSAMEKFTLEHHQEPALLEQAKRFLDQDFYIVERELQVGERLRDFARCKTKEDFMQLLTPVIHWLNITQTSKKSSLIPDIHKVYLFDTQKNEDIVRYFSGWLPFMMGYYLGKMHKLGLSHGFPHAQNWSAVGTIYDLDSLRGEPLELSDSPITENAMCVDITQALGALEESLHPDTPNYLSSLLDKTQPIKAKTSFIRGYYSGRPIEKGKIPNYSAWAVNSYFDGKKIHRRIITPQEWFSIIANVFNPNITKSKQFSEKIHADYTKLLLKIEPDYSI